MQLQHIETARLSVSALNMRSGRKAPDIAGLLPSVRARGILVPLLVRAGHAEGAFEIVAGRRRFFAAQAVAAETGLAEPLPCAIIEAGDDAAALEASLIENVARMDAHEVEQWETYTRLVTKEGRTPDEIGATFGLTETQVKRVLALGNLLPGIRNLYRKEEIDAATVRFLTMATKVQQKEWLAIHADPERHAPVGHSLKTWLFGGQSIPTTAALFDLATYDGGIVADLFGEGGYFADASAFWTAQRAAVEARKAAYLEAGWSAVVILEPGSYFNSWDYEKTPRKKGGRVYAVLSQRGEVAFHEGYLSRKEARAAGRAGPGDGGAKPARPEVTGTLQTYIDLHRHAAVRADLVLQPMVALRLMAAHAIQGSYLFAVRAEPQRGGSNAVTESIARCSAEAAFDAERRKALALLGFDEGLANLLDGRVPDGNAGIFVKLLALDDAEVLAIVAVVMGEALEAGSAVAEALGRHLGTDMARRYAPDAALFDLTRDREVLTAIVAELAGEAVAAANAKEKTKTLKAVIRDCLDGTNGRAKVEGWVPRWLAFPPTAYTARGGINAVRRAAEIAALLEPAHEPDNGPATPQPGLAAVENADEDPPFDPDPPRAAPVEGGSEYAALENEAVAAGPVAEPEPIAA